MSQNARKSSLAVCLVAVGALVAIPAVAQKSPVPQPIPVNVENTPNVNVANTPSVNVANTPAVTLSSGASVAVTSPLDGSGNPSPIAVLDAFQPYEATCDMEFNGTQVGDCTFTIPAGKELVVQEFDAGGQVETGTRLENLGWESTPNDNPVAHQFPTTFMGTNGTYDYFATHQETRLYVPPNNAPACVVFLTNTSNQGFTCSISGFLVDVPQGSDGKVTNGGQHQRQTMPPMRRPAPQR